MLQGLESRGLIQLPIVTDKTVCNGHIFYIITRSLEERTQLIAHLTANNVNTVFHYVPLHSSPAGLKYGRPASDMQVTDSISDRLLRLPLYYEMEDSDIERVVELIQDFYEARF
jgi:dTDP-4-amino-4,6-dideoxygalactose transaminase